VTETDPLCQRYLEALERRLQSAPDAVQQLLQRKLEQLRAAAGPDHPKAASPVLDGETASALTEARSEQDQGSLLAQLNSHIDAVTQPQGDTAVSGAFERRAELRNARRFRETWSRICAEDEVERALERGPENAGPLNPHRLLLHTMALMRELSPDYLHRFLSQMDTLLWLEKAQGKRKLEKPLSTVARSPRQRRVRKRESPQP